ncbi:MAG: hypothetical protein VB110_02745 [Bacteroidales bacterium]|jgi:hypothetical protein|nr:hypothetical protein [Bacteroidales bacterium]
MGQKNTIYTDNSQKIYVQTETVNGYPQNYIMLNGEKIRVRLSKKISMDREFAGVQPWEIADYNNNKIQYYIPVDEMSVNGITQNP